MREVTGPIIAIALVLVAVFVPLGLHHRPDRPVLQAVRPDDRDLDGDFGLQLADAFAGAGRAAAKGPSRAEGCVDALHGQGVRLVLPSASTASSREARTPIAAACKRVALAQVAALMGVYVRAGWPHRLSVPRSPGRLRAAPRTSSIWSASRSCPTAPRSTAPKR